MSNEYFDNEKNVGCQLEKNRQKIANTKGWRVYDVPEILTTSDPDIRSNYTVMFYCTFNL